MKKTLRRVAKPHIIRIVFIASVFLFSTLGYLVYLLYTAKAEANYWNQIENRQLVLARAGARSIQTCLHFISDDNEKRSKTDKTCMVFTCKK